MTATTSIRGENIYPLAGNALANVLLTKYKRNALSKNSFLIILVQSKEIKRRKRKKDCARVFKVILSLPDYSFCYLSDI